MTRAYHEYINAIARDEIDREMMEKDMETIKEDDSIEPYYHLNGFTHRKSLCVEESKGVLRASPLEWGFIVSWSKEEKRYLNARGETSFTKVSFRSAIKKRRVIVPLDGFYDYHHHKKSAYPYYIHHADDSVILAAGIASTWVDKDSGEEHDTFAIVTCEPNDVMAFIHNKPNTSTGPRMPLLFDKESAWKWMNSDTDTEEVRELIKPYPSDKLSYYTVEKLKGKSALGNVEGAKAKKDWGLEDLVHPTEKGLFN